MLKIMQTQQYNTYMYPKFSDRQVWANSVDTDKMLMPTQQFLNPLTYRVKQTCSNFRVSMVSNYGVHNLHV